MSRLIARIPYLNSLPLYRGLDLGNGNSLIDYVPSELGRQASSGSVAGGLLSLADYLRLQDTFERLGPFGIAVRGRSRSALLFSRKPIRQLDGAKILVSAESSTTVLLLRLLLEQRYHVLPQAYLEGHRTQEDADALLLIGDEAVRFSHANTLYPFEVDLAFEWWLWQHLPFVFAVWAIRKDVPSEDKRQMERALSRALGINMKQLGEMAQEQSPLLGVPAGELLKYLEGFHYRLSAPEEEGLARFTELVHDYNVLRSH
ncbi:MAG: menaquinone biosynthesis protein [Candidatus Omnitrophica bacterium]|nr:menaquinone biosynthesis protein [Candidatus Omnitrophota bacterium]